MDLQLCEKATPGEIHDGLLAERKLDGVRAYSENGRLKTRSGRDVTAQFPEISLPDLHVFDGELVTTDFKFASANRRVQTEDRFKIDLLTQSIPARFVVFDAPAINGTDITDKPLTERKSLLEPSIPDNSGIIPITVSDEPHALWERAQAEGWEGIVLKQPDSPYSGGRTSDWLKIKDWQEDTFEIVDWKRTENDGFVIHVDTGEDWQKVAVNGQADQAAVTDAVANSFDAKAEIQFLEWTDDGRMRKPSFRGVA